MSTCGPRLSLMQQCDKSVSRYFSTCEALFTYSDSRSGKNLVTDEELKSDMLTKYQRSFIALSHWSVQNKNKTSVMLKEEKCALFQGDNWGILKFAKLPSPPPPLRPHFCIIRWKNLGEVKRIEHSENEIILQFELFENEIEHKVLQSSVRKAPVFHECQRPKVEGALFLPQLIGC